MPEGLDQTGSRLDSASVGIQSCIEASPPAQLSQPFGMESSAAQREPRNSPLAQREKIQGTLDETYTAKVAAGGVPSQQRLSARQTEVAGGVIALVQRATDEPDGVSLPYFGKHDSTRQVLPSARDQ